MSLIASCQYKQSDVATSKHFVCDMMCWLGAAEPFVGSNERACSHCRCCLPPITRGVVVWIQQRLDEVPHGSANHVWLDYWRVERTNDTERQTCGVVECCIKHVDVGRLRCDAQNSTKMTSPSRTTFGESLSAA